MPRTSVAWPRRVLTLAACGGRRHRRPAATGRGARRRPPKIAKLSTPRRRRGQRQHRRLGRLRRGRHQRPEVDWVTPFEKETGCQVNVKIAATSDEMVTLMKTGQYDVVSASGDASLRLIYGGDVAPVNTDLITNYKDVFDGPEEQAVELGRRPAVRHPARPRRQPADVPHRHGQAGADSWGAVFDPTSPYKGKITAYDSPIYIADAALYLMKTKPELASRTRTRWTTTQFDAAVDLLKEQNEIDRRVLVATTPRRCRRSRPATRCSAPPGRSSPTWPQADKAPVEAVLPQRGRDRLVGHLDGRGEGQAPELRLPVDEPHRLAEGQRPGRRVVR